jgi:hypothetical protein
MVAVRRLSAFTQERHMPGTVRLHRVLATKPEKVYRAFVEADAMAKWLPPNGFTCTVHSFDAKVGGGFKMSFAISPTVKVIRSAENMWSSCPANACVTRINSTIQICRVKCRSR